MKKPTTLRENFVSTRADAMRYVGAGILLGLTLAILLNIITRP